MRHQPGVAIGLVKSVDDPSGEGRIQLTYPWLEASMVSSWAPIAAPLAGAKHGAWLMPEVDDEVLVAFDHGDFSHPYVIGFLFNGVDKPFETEKKNRVIRSPGGHELRFEDSDSAKKVIVKSNGGLTITLDDAGESIEIKGGGRTVTMKGGEVKIT